MRRRRLSPVPTIIVVYIHVHAIWLSCFLALRFPRFVYLSGFLQLLFLLADPSGLMSNWHGRRRRDARSVLLLARLRARDEFARRSGCGGARRH